MSLGRCAPRPGARGPSRARGRKLAAIASTAPHAEPTLADYERRLRRAGLPLLIEDYSAREDVFTRALPFLALWFATELLNAVNDAWSTAANLAAVLVGLVVLLAPVVVLNRLQGQRALSLPQRVGGWELAVFVLVPALLPLIAGGQLILAAVTVVGNLLVLGIVYVVVGYGVLSILRWSLGRLLDQLAGSLTMLAKAVPLLLFFALVLFVNMDMWQVFAAVSDEALLGVTALFVGLGTLFLTARLPREVRQLEREVGADPPLTRRQRLNVGLVMFVNHALQVLVVSVAIGLFFVAFGLLTIGPEVRERWIGTEGDGVGTLVIGDESFTITAELLRISAAIASFSGLYYAISVLTDSTYRGEFLSELERSMRDTFRLRADYLAARAARAVSVATPEEAGDAAPPAERAERPAQRAGPG